MTAARPGAALDLVFLDAQTHGDAALACEVLALFVEQASRLVPSLPEMAREDQTAAAHLLKGSCQGIGASVAVDLLQRYEAADATGRQRLHRDLSAAFAELDEVIAAHLAAP